MLAGVSQALHGQVIDGQSPVQVGHRDQREPARGAVIPDHATANHELHGWGRGGPQLTRYRSPLIPQSWIPPPRLLSPSSGRPRRRKCPRPADRARAIQLSLSARNKQQAAQVSM